MHVRTYLLALRELAKAKACSNTDQFKINICRVSVAIIM